MRAKTFDAIARELGTDSTRRGISRLLGGAAGHRQRRGADGKG